MIKILGEGVKQFYKGGKNNVGGLGIGISIGIGIGIYDLKV